CVERVVELDEHSHRAREFAGGWSDYVAARALAQSQQYEAHDKFRAERRRLVDRMRSQRSWAEQGVRTAKKKAPDHDKAQRDFRATRPEKQASKVRATERRHAQPAVAESPWE